MCCMLCRHVRNGKHAIHTWFCKQQCQSGLQAYNHMLIAHVKAIMEEPVQAGKHVVLAILAICKESEAP